jgi:hypothetical protein
MKENCIDKGKFCIPSPPAEGELFEQELPVILFAFE